MCTKNGKKFWVYLLCAMMLASCGSGTGEDTTNVDTMAAETETETETVDMRYVPDLEAKTFGGMEFCTATFECPNFNWQVIVEEETGEVLNDAMYRRNMTVEETYDVTLTQYTYKDGENILKTAVAAGDDAYELVITRCPNALTFWKDGLLLPIDQLPNVNLEKKYWDQSINESLSIGGCQYIAEGAFNLDSYDLTFCLVFNKAMAEEHGIQDIYETVSGGNWTMDRMEQDMVTVTTDWNGDGAMDESDMWGYTAHPKMIAPGFWIGAGVTSIAKDEEDLPYISMMETGFMDVFERTFRLIWDSDGAYPMEGDHLDIPTECRNMFAENRCLYMDMSFFFIPSLRDMDTDFGVIPYPKYTAEQDSYHARVCYYMPTVVPVTCADQDFTGYMLEVLNCESYKTVIPAYYEISLKSKASRDEESADMLDLIFAARVIDIGDSTLCGDIRDNFIYQMMKNDKRDLASQVASKEKSIVAKLSVMSE